MRALLYKLGYKVTRRSYPLRTFRESMQQLKEKGFYPGTIIDAGVADGTRDLYEVFPEAHIVLVEPLREYQSDMERITAQYGGEYIVAAAGEKVGESSLRIGNDPRKSSLIRSDLRGGVAATRTVPVITLDGLIDKGDYRRPYLIKIDVEGAELAVFRGATNALRHADVVILEVAVLDRGGTAPELCEVTSRMRDYGFVAYDIVGAADGQHGALAHVDVVFVEEHGRFRPI